MTKEYMAELVNYLATKPYAEVFKLVQPLIQELQKCEETKSPLAVVKTQES